MPELPDPSAFETSPEERKRYFQYIRWYSVLRELLDLKGEGETLLAQASDLFSDVVKPLWQRALALVYYSSLFFPDAKLCLSREEADEICSRFLVVLINPLEPALLKEMAANVYERVVWNQINFVLQRKDTAVAVEALECARRRTELLKQVLGPSHQNVRSLRGFLKSFSDYVIASQSWREAPVVVAPAIQPPPKPGRRPWWKRLDAWLTGLFQD